MDKNDHEQSLPTKEDYESLAKLAKDGIECEITDGSENHDEYIYRDNVCGYSDAGT